MQQKEHIQRGRFREGKIQRGGGGGGGEEGGIFRGRVLSPL